MLQYTEDSILPEIQYKEWKITQCDEKKVKRWVRNWYFFSRMETIKSNSSKHKVILLSPLCKTDLRKTKWNSTANVGIKIIFKSWSCPHIEIIKKTCKVKSNNRPRAVRKKKFKKKTTKSLSQIRAPMKGVMNKSTEWARRKHLNWGLRRKGQKRLRMKQLN